MQSLQTWVPSKVSTVTLAPKAVSAIEAKTFVLPRFKTVEKEYTLDQTHAVVQGFSINGQGYTTIAIPVQDNAGNYSRFIAIYDSTNQYLNSFLSVFHKTDSGTISYIGQSDNRTLTAVVKEDGTLLSATLLDEQGQHHDISSFLRFYANQTPSNSLASLMIRPAYADGWWSCFRQCLAAMGVPAYFITLVGAACAVVCGLTAGAGCVICILAVLAAYGSIGVTCAEHCWGLF